MPNNDNVIKFFEDIKDAFQKAIGTSSSVNEERDERSVENYVRTGGNIMENTTEPDPKGDIAITKSFPTPNAGDLVDQTTRPEGDVSVSDAPNNPAVVPNQETIPSDATSAVAPSKTDEVNTPDTVTVAKAAAGKCPECGQSLPVEKADDKKEEDAIEKVADEPESKEEAAKETPADEKAEMKKSLWGGAFAPAKPRF